MALKIEELDPNEEPLKGNFFWDGHEAVYWITDPECGLKAYIALHSLTLGPALGGCRIHAYAREEDALTDVLRLAHGMSYKSALAGLPLGGGKSVIIADAHQEKTPEMIRAMGRAVQALEGRYVIAEDVGSTEADMRLMSEESAYVTGVPARDTDAKTVAGDPSPYTARGIFSGIRSAAGHRYGTESLKDKRIGVQGAGNVGLHLIRLLAEDGAQVIVADPRPDALQRALEAGAAKTVDTDAIWEQEVEVFAPCALGGILNQDTIPRLRADIVAGGANNQLWRQKEDLALLEEREILYAPDFLINAGGVIMVWAEYACKQGEIAAEEATPEKIGKRVDGIGPVLDNILKSAADENMNTLQAAEAMAESRLHADQPQIRASS